jgi:GNAT superfamily N-acetyltransferase
MVHTIRRATDDDADLGLIARIVNEVSPEDSTSIDELRWAAATYPGGVRFVAETGGQAVGVGTVGRIYMHPPEFPAFWGTLDVLPNARRQGVGEALLIAISREAREAGKNELHIPAIDSRPEGIEFLLHRGFTEYERAKAVELPLTGLSKPSIVLPAGVDLHTLAERPDLVAGVHAVAEEAFSDIPGGETPMAAGDLAAFRVRDVDRPSIPKDGFFVATDTLTGQVIGYASLLLLPGQANRKAWHDMTAVLRAWRGRGLARALKHATIGWAIDHGLEILMTGNDINNAPMRAVNARLGYRSTPDLLTMRGPLFGGMMDRA